MKVIIEKTLWSLDTWGGAVSTRDRIIAEEKETEFEVLIEELYPNGIDETELNDLLWHDSNWIFEQLGIEEEEEEEE